MNKTLTLMIQGCTSDAGKSVMVAGLCRWLSRSGIAVVPFKPQNMALNSAVTADGGEIGRAQALQAQAAGVEAHTDMNPILLKPSSDTGAQVIVHGKALSHMEAVQYHDYKQVAMQAVLQSHQRLSDAYDFVVVEGAGSPAEINLRDGDVANMGFAEAVDCPVILVADIDRGGVFAHLVGTLDLLSESEKKRVIGFIINRFRGDIALLQPGLEWLEKKTKKPVIGVVPYLENFYLDAEDAINCAQVVNPEKKFCVVVPVLNRISNHTDFDALRLHPGVDLKFVSVDAGLPPCDLLILPGTKNVRSDLDKLLNLGWRQAIMRHLRYGGYVLGICGGMQMLGEWVEDSHGIEGPAGRSDGLGLLAISTVLAKEKQLFQRKGKLFLQGDAAFQAYEIHCGDTFFQQGRRPFAQLASGDVEGVIGDDNQVAGTYLHGIFDCADAAETILAWAGYSGPSAAVNLFDEREKQLDRLCETLTQCLSFQSCPDEIAAVFANTNL